MLQKTSLHPSWIKNIGDQFDLPYFLWLQNFLQQRKQDNAIIYPNEGDIFRAMKTTSFDDIKVVILGQDPYHGPKQANGLSFSVPKGVKIPPSLRNIFRELESDTGIAYPVHGDLTSWAEQWVLLLNTTLTVEKGEPASHAKKGWEKYTDQIIRKISQEKKDIVFLLWWAHAKNKIQYIDVSRHCVLSCAHPSPLSAYRGFFGCKHFSQVNTFLSSCNVTPIQWSSISK